jgi:hypothetical protein
MTKSWTVLLIPEDPYKNQRAFILKARGTGRSNEPQRVG